MDEEHYSRGKVRECMRTLARRRGSKGNGNAAIQTPSSRRGKPRRDGDHRRSENLVPATRGTHRRHARTLRRDGMPGREEASSKRGSSGVRGFSMSLTGHAWTRRLGGDHKRAETNCLTTRSARWRWKVKIDELPSSRKTRQWPADYIS